jgi:hypothetical protein
MIKAKLTLLVVFIALLSTAIGQADWTAITSKDGFLTLKFPAGWTAVDQDSAAFQKTIEELRKNNPNMVKMLEGTDGKDMALQVFDLNDDPSDGADNMNLKIAKNPGITDKDLGEVGKAILAQMPFKGKKESKIVNMPQGKTLTYWGDMETKLEGGQVLNIQVMGYLYLKADKMLIITFSTSNGKMAKLRETFDKIVKTAKHS